MALQRTRGLSAAQFLWFAGRRSAVQHFFGGRSPLNAVALGDLRRLAATLLIALASASAVHASESGSNRGSSLAGYRLGAITVQVYDPQTAQFTELQDQFWNQVDLFLLSAVEVLGPTHSATSGPLVEVLVFKGDKVVSRQQTKVGSPEAASGRYFVPTWITGPFCEDLVIRARFVGRRAEARVEKRIEFRCGE
jgi:hypothetical protein